MIAADEGSLRRVWSALVEAITDQGPQEVTIKPHKSQRTAEQNRRMWAMLSDLSQQVKWPVDGQLQRITAEDWKHIMSAGLKQHQRVAQGIDGGFVILGQSTRKMTVRQMGDLIDLMTAFGAERQVRWSDPAVAAYEQ